MTKQSVFTKRERALEESYFRARDAHLLEMLRARAHYDELAEALKEKLEIDDPILLERIQRLGITHDTGAALLLAPLVQIAWAAGSVTKNARRVILHVAESCGVDPGSPAHDTLSHWLDHQPSTELFETALAAIRAGLSVLTPAEQDQRVQKIIWTCRRVAMASPGVLGAFGDPWATSHTVTDLLEHIAAKIRPLPVHVLASLKGLDRRPKPKR